MGKKNLTVMGTGDALFVARFPDYYKAQKEAITEFINSHELKITNLETNLSDFGSYANAYSGGTWINTPKEYFADLKGMGFNFYGTANNHCMDYGHKGLVSTIECLDSQGVAHAGTGLDLQDAQKPALLDLNGKKVAVIAVDASFEKASKAGNPTCNFQGRPGVNYLRHSTSFPINKEQEKVLRQISEQTGINYTRDFNIATGYVNPDPEGVYVFGGITFTTNVGEPTTKCNKIDKERILSIIKQAKNENDYVFMQIHCHDDDNRSHAHAPEYLEEFCRASIEAGVSAVFGGGCHELRGIEIYKGKPIFYSLGDFIYQGPQVEKLPADFMEQFNAPLDLTAEQALNVRSRNGKVGLHLNKENYLTVLPSLTFDGEDLKEIKLLPVGLNFDKKDKLNGLPSVAQGEEAEEILNVINNLSSKYNLKFKLQNGFILLNN